MHNNIECENKKGFEMRVKIFLSAFFAFAFLVSFASAQVGDVEDCSIVTPDSHCTKDANGAWVWKDQSFVCGSCGPCGELQSPLIGTAPDPLSPCKVCDDKGDKVNAEAGRGISVCMVCDGNGNPTSAREGEFVLQCQRCVAGNLDETFTGNYPDDKEQASCFKCLNGNEIPKDIGTACQTAFCDQTKCTPNPDSKTCEIVFVEEDDSSGTLPAFFLSILNKKDVRLSEPYPFGCTDLCNPPGKHQIIQYPKNPQITLVNLPASPKAEGNKDIAKVIGGIAEAFDVWAEGSNGKGGQKKIYEELCKQKGRKKYVSMDPNSKPVSFECDGKGEKEYKFVITPEPKPTEDPACANYGAKDRETSFTLGLTGTCANYPCAYGKLLDSIGSAPCPASSTGEQCSPYVDTEKDGVIEKIGCVGGGVFTNVPCTYKYKYRCTSQIQKITVKFTGKFEGTCNPK